MIGGAGNDVYIIDNAGDTITETLGGGTDEVRFSLTRYTLPAHVEKGVSTATSNSVITGNALANEISGTAGWDTIDGGAGADRLVGGYGNDWYYVDNEGDVIVELNGYAGGSDTVETGLAYYVIPNGVELVNGTSATQTLIGNDADNWLTSNGGGDTLIGGKGNDLYQIKAGDIYIENAGEGVDMIRTDMSYFVLPEHFEEIQAVSWSIGQTLIGNAADNRIIGTLLNDRSDTIDGGLGADLMIGYHGSDIYYVDNMFDVVSEEAHHGTADEVRATLSTYTLAANVEKLTGFAGGRQSLAGNGLANTIVGGNGDDRIFGGPGPDVLSGGAGADRFVYTANAESTQTSLDTILDFEVGIDKIDLTALGPVQVTFTDNGMGGVSVTVQSGFTTIFMIRVNAAVTAADLVQNVLYGTAGDDPLSGTAASETIQGHAGNDQLSGGEGDDTLAGGAGNDSLDGGLGLDTLVGGLGDDIYLVDGSDTVFEHAGEGTDEVRTSRSYDLGAHVENLRATSDAGLALRGNEGANSIFGGGGIDRLEGLAGNDVLDGGGGADELLGGRGNDIYIVGSGDTVIEAAGEGVDEVRTALGSRSDPAAMYVLAANVEKLSGTSATGQGVHANALDNVVSMGGGGDLVVLDAGGNDLVSGGGGDDFLYWGATFTSADKADGGAGFDTVGLLGSYALVFDADDFVSVEKLAVYSSGNPAAPNSYSLTMHDGNVAAGQRMMVVAQSLQASEAFTFNGAAELDGSFNVRGGRGADTITGGAKADVLWGGLGADMLKGGGGADVFEYKAAAESTSAASDVILAFGAGDKINLSAIDADGNAANGNSKFAWLGDGAFTHQAGQLRVSRHADHASVWVAEADVDGDGTADLTILLVAAGDFLPTKGDFWL
jgi:Ca2+-binding RTX toxin-like protein